MKLGENTSNCMLYGETGKTSIEPIIEKRMISFWLRLTQDKPQIYIVYSFIIKLRNKNHYESQWIEKNCRDSLELRDAPLLEKSKLKYGYPIYQLM